MGSCQPEGSLSSRKRCHIVALTTCQTTLRGRWDSDNDARQTHFDRDCLDIHTLCPLFKPELHVRTGRGLREVAHGTSFLFPGEYCFSLSPVCFLVLLGSACEGGQGQGCDPNNFHSRVVSSFFSFHFFSFPSLSLSVWYMLMGVCVLIVIGDQRSPLSVFLYRSPPQFLRQDFLLN